MLYCKKQNWVIGILTHICHQHLYNLLQLATKDTKTQTFEQKIFYAEALFLTWLI